MHCKRHPRCTVPLVNRKASKNNMSADRPGSTTYSAGFGPRMGTIRKPDPYGSLPTTPRGSRSPRLSTTGDSPRSPPTVDVNRLSYSISEQYKLKKYRDEYADRVNDDVAAFHVEEESRLSSARRQQEAYRASLQEQIRMRSASRESARQKDRDQKLAINSDFEKYVQETLSHKEHQRQRHMEYCRQVQQQQNNINELASRRKMADDAVAETINRDAQLKKLEDDERKMQKRQLQRDLADEMKREHETRRVNKELARVKAAEDDRTYLAFVDAKAAREEHDRANHIKSRQKVLPSVSLPSIDKKEEPVPNYLALLAEERKLIANQKSEQQRANRDTLQRQIDERHAKKLAEMEKDRIAREIAEKDALAFESEQRSARQRQRAAAKENENLVASQINESIRRQYRIDENEWKTMSIPASPRKYL